jgi:hypothetical protein
MFSFFDKLFHPFECPNPKCRHKFYGLSRWLIHGNEVVCQHVLSDIGALRVLDLVEQFRDVAASDFGEGSITGLRSRVDVERHIAYANKYWRFLRT